jgi:hypothetical protein
MKKNTLKKLQLVKIKIASLNNATGKGNQNDAVSNSSCAHICPTVCSQINCTTL